MAANQALGNQFRKRKGGGFNIYSIWGSTMYTERRQDEYDMADEGDYEGGMDAGGDAGGGGGDL